MRSEQRVNKLMLVLVCAVLTVSLFVVLDFDGDLDFRGHYVILQKVPYSPEKIAFEVERWDDQALNGPRYAVIIDDHTPSRYELQQAMISFWRHRHFALADQNVRISWSGPNRLILETDVPNTSPDWVTGQTQHIADVVVHYSGRP